MAHITRFIVACASTVFSAVALISSLVASSVDFLILRSFAWIDFTPDPRTSIDLDRAAFDMSTVELPAPAARFKSWLTRALTHRRYGGECFDLA
jgi:hypothetical protein